MNILMILVPLALILGLCFIWAFLWAAKGGQFDDLETPAYRMLLEEQKLSEKK